MKSLVEYMKSVENKKRTLEESVDKLNEDIALLRSTGVTSTELAVTEQADTEEVKLMAYCQFYVALN